MEGFSWEAPVLSKAPCLDLAVLILPGHYLGLSSGTSFLQDAKVRRDFWVQGCWASLFCRLGESGPEKVVACSNFTQQQSQTKSRLSASWTEGRGGLSRPLLREGLPEGSSALTRDYPSWQLSTLYFLWGCITVFLVITLIRIIIDY